MKPEDDYSHYLNGKYGTRLIGKKVPNQYNMLYIVHSIHIPEPGQYKFRTVVFTLECELCNKVKELTYQTVITGTFNFCKCGKKQKTKKTREEMIKEINDEYAWMLELNKTDQLIPYLRSKYPEDVCWFEMEKEEEKEAKEQQLIDKKYNYDEDIDDIDDEIKNMFRDLEDY